MDNSQVCDVMYENTGCGDTQSTKSVTVWCDGCYDMGHFGHANSLRQAKLLGNKLIVGVHNDEDIKKHKGCPPVFSEEERYEMLRAIKWVDEVVEAAPYVTTLATLDKYNCDFCAHGNDITMTEDGKDTYQEVKDKGRYKEVERTQGVSTTNLIKRILAATSFKIDSDFALKRDINGNPVPTSEKSGSLWTGNTPFLLTTSKLQLFLKSEEPKAGDIVVYVAGAFDILHPGHLAFLKKAHELGNYVIVGLHSDATIKTYKGRNPIMKLEERAWSICSCRYVSEIVIGAPYNITEEVLEHLNVSIVVKGKVRTGKGNPYEPIEQALKQNSNKKWTIQEVDSGSSLTTESIMNRVAQRRHQFEKRNNDKEAKEHRVLKAMELEREQTEQLSTLQPEM